MTRTCLVWRFLFRSLVAYFGSPLVSSGQGHWFLMVWLLPRSPKLTHTQRDARWIRARTFGSRRVWVAATRVFEHCEASLIYCGGDTIVRSMTRVAHLTLQWFGCYRDPPKSRACTHKRDARSEHGHLVPDVCGWPHNTGV